MRQFDVYANPNPATRKAYPYIVDVQHPVLDGLATRIVIPLGRPEAFHNESMKTLSPVIEYQGEKLVLLTPQIASIPVRLLKNPVGSLSHLREEIIAAIDFAVTGT
ncbi:MAG: CcdB family protein [Gammaproteobacteria bacterium]|nr:CcdB family protein [Gammaproteobacteria bacterium]MBU1724173.1 CcdB family protein [Gammaproteobacteria bacterium]MBU2006730.1 CcdB family protein [Gammaproteobacteria bacterium]